MSSRHGRARARIESAIVVLAALSGAWVSVTTAVAQEAPLLVDVGPCVTLQSPEERFACYEAAVDAAQPAPRAPMARIPVATDTPAPLQPSAPRVTEAARAPVPAPTPAVQANAPARGASTRREERRSVQEISGTVTALRQTVPNAFLITLDNGQVWRQVRPEAYPLRSGQKVRLYTTGWGTSYRLEAEKIAGFIQVERVK